jgi:amino acid transporter
VLTAAVSLTAGVEAIASASPALWGYRIELSLLLLAVITLINLRGAKETGTLMSGPVYLFLFVYLSMLAYGAFRVLTGGVTPLATTAPLAVQPLTAFVLLRAFATGCTAMTGIEAISNGVPAFKPPEPKNAGRTLLVMALLLGVLFVGSIGITQALGVVSGPQETILSALAGKQPVIKQSGKDRKGYLYIKDTAQGLLAVAEGLMQNPALRGEAFNIVPNEAYTVLELVRAVSDATGLKLEPVVQNPSAHFEDEHLDNAKAAKELGWQPKYGLAQGLAETIAWYREHPPAASKPH